MESPPQIKSIESVPSYGGETLRRVSHQSQPLPDPCSVSVPQPGIGIPPGSIAFVGPTGLTEYLEPGDNGDILRIGTDGRPVWSPA